MSHPQFVPNRPARSKYAAALCTDAAYLPYTLFVATQLQQYSGIPDLDILIVVPEDCAIPPSLDSHDFRICRFTTNGLFDGLFVRNHLSENAYHRLVLSRFLRTDYGRILYVDSDVFVHGGDFQRLFEVDMGGHPIAAVRDIPQWKDPKAHVQQLSDLDLPNLKYFNSGVMLFDTAAFDDADYLGQCLAFGRANKHRMTHQDQQLLNCVLQGNWKEISPVWNWMQPVRSPLLESSLPIAISHFVGRAKPWNDPKKTIPPRFVLPLSGFLKRHVPEHPALTIPSTKDVTAAHLRTLTFKNFARIPKFKKFLARFPNDLDESR